MHADKQAILNSRETAPAGGYYVWDGIDEDDRPMTREEMEAGLAAVREVRGHQAEATKKSSFKTHTTGAA